MCENLLQFTYVLDNLPVCAGKAVGNHCAREHVASSVQRCHYILGDGVLGATERIVHNKPRWKVACKITYGASSGIK